MKRRFGERDRFAQRKEIPLPRPTGFRAMTPGLFRASETAQLWGPQTAVSKRRAHTAFNAATRYLGLRAPLIELMNKLISFSQEVDWEADTRPIVWPDNLRLLEQCSIGSLSALKRSLRALAETGLIAFRDSPTGRRSGKRDRHNNKIVLDRSFGIDLSPLGLKTPELEMLVATARARQNEWRELCRQFTRDRKRLVSLIQAGRDGDLPGPWEECAREHDVFEIERATLRNSDALERLAALHGRLLAVLERANAAYARAAEIFAAKEDARHGQTPGGEAGREGMDAEKADPEQSTGEPLIQNTSQRNSHNTYRQERRSTDAEQLDLPGTGYADKEGYGTKATGADHAVPEPERLARPVDARTLMTLCPEFAAFVEEPGRWTDIAFAAERVVAPMLKIPASTWHSACRLLAPDRAATAVALIFEKYHAGLIETPGAYLNGMVDRALDGRLDLPSSLFHWRKPRKFAKNRQPIYCDQAITSEPKRI
jgi:replication initiation protein RepC